MTDNEHTEKLVTEILTMLMDFTDAHIDEAMEAARKQRQESVLPVTSPNYAQVRHDVERIALVVAIVTVLKRELQAKKDP